MFSAKLITNPSFVFFKRHSQLLILLSIPLSSIIINSLLLGDIDRKILFFIVPAYLLVFYVMYLIRKKVMNSMQDRRMELDTDTIRIFNKSGSVDLEISISSVESFNLQKEYKYEESFGKVMLKLFRGIENYHFLQVHSAGHGYTMRFMLDSIYMESKLNEIIQHWRAMGIPIIYSNEPIKGSDVVTEMEAIN